MQGMLAVNCSAFQSTGAAYSLVTLSAGNRELIPIPVDYHHIFIYYQEPHAGTPLDVFCFFSIIFLSSVHPTRLALRGESAQKSLSKWHARALHCTQEKLHPCFLKRNHRITQRELHVLCWERWEPFIHKRDPAPERWKLAITVSSYQAGILWTESQKFSRSVSGSVCTKASR